MEQPVHRYQQLDSLRGLAAVFVMFGHLLGRSGLLPFFNQTCWTPLGILFNGSASVAFFFVLSGYVLALPFVNGTKPLSIAAFYVKRVLRIYPALIFTIFFALLLKYLLQNRASIPHFSSPEIPWNWQYTSNNINQLFRTLLLIGPQFDANLIDPPIWSLVIEMRMSLVLPLIIVVVSRCKLLVNVIIMLILGLLTYHYQPIWASAVFYLGVLLAKYNDDLIAVVSQWKPMPVFLLSILAVVLYNNFLEILTWYERSHTPDTFIFVQYVASAGSAIIIVVAVSRIGLAGILKSKPLLFLGRISYSLYLVHVPIIWTVYSLAGFGTWPGLIIVIVIAVSVMIAYLMLVFIERPFLKLATLLINKYALLNRLNIKNPRHYDARGYST